MTENQVPLCGERISMLGGLIFAGIAITFVVFGFREATRKNVIIFATLTILFCAMAVMVVVLDKVAFTRAHAGHEEMHGKIQTEFETAKRGDLVVIGEEIIAIEWVEVVNGIQRFTFVRHNHSDFSTPKQLAVEHARLVRFGTPEHKELVQKHFARIYHDLSEPLSQNWNPSNSRADFFL